MKIPFKIILSIVYAGFCFTSSAQSGTNHSIGLQLNPYLNADLFNGNSTRFVYALRYNFSLKDHITLGLELSGYNIRVPTVAPAYTSSIFNVGGFFRYSFLPASRIRPFFEFSPYYTFLRYNNLPENTYNGVSSNGKDSFLAGYLAPGISLFNKSHKFSLDLFYKFSTKMFVNDDKLVLSYRLNFRF
jgi:hypothetical protein